MGQVRQLPLDEVMLIEPGSTKGTFRVIFKEPYGPNEIIIQAANTYSVRMFAKMAQAVTRTVQEEEP